MTWLPINTFPMPSKEDLWNKGSGSFLVDNGDQVGEAELKQDWGAWDDEETEAPYRWAWTHKSTCSCCHGFMEPQPLWWQPLPAPATAMTIADCPKGSCQRHQRCMYLNHPLCPLNSRNSP